MAVVMLVSLPCSFAQDDSDQNQPPDMPRMGMDRPGGPRQGPGEGDRDGRGGPGDRRGGPPRFGVRPDERGRRPELTNEQIDSILEELKKRDPNAAKQLADIRTKEPEKFLTELRQTAGPEIGSVIMRFWSERRREEFLVWLENYVPKEAEELKKLKENDPNLYTQRYDLTWRKYDRIYEQRRNPELTKVLVADLHLLERQRDLQRKYQAAKTDEDKKELMAQLEDVVSDRYDLTVRRKQMEYEQLLRRLEALQNDVKASLEEIKIWRTDEYKEETVKKRLEELTTERRGRGFPWE